LNARILAGKEGVSKALEILRGGGVVGIPTETVYGLAADAFQPLAVARIFEAKGRPLTDPLIVHLPEGGWLDRVACFSSLRQQQLAARLAAAFWPGPMTLLLSKRGDLSDLVTAGSERVAVRVTSHPLFQEILWKLDSPIAAPSANRFGRISPTSAEDVRMELGEVIPFILDGGPCRYGMESTIVSVGEDHLEIHRPGPITEDQLNRIGHVIIKTSLENIPGSLPGHYAPKKELRIIELDIKWIQPNCMAGLLAFTNPSAETAQQFAQVEVLSPNGDLREAAANFYGALRRLDMSNTEIIFSQSFPEEGIGVAIMDRLRRAEYGSKHEIGHVSSPASNR
jgi:L-threonylcarbamoyladenylate synthase